MGEISKKVQENKLKWYAHEMSREEEEYVGKKSDGDGCAGDGKEDWSMTWQGKDYRAKMHKTRLYGGD